jgi:hypothetical protein
MEKSSPNTSAALVSSLLEATRGRKLKWEETVLRDTYRTKLKVGEVTFGRRGGMSNFGDVFVSFLLKLSDESNKEVYSEFFAIEDPVASKLYQEIENELRQSLQVAINPFLAELKKL